MTPTAQHGSSMSHKSGNHDVTKVATDIDMRNDYLEFQAGKNYSSRCVFSNGFRFRSKNRTKLLPVAGDKREREIEFELENFILHGL